MADNYFDQFDESTEQEEANFFDQYDTATPAQPQAKQPVDQPATGIVSSQVQPATQPEADTLGESLTKVIENTPERWKKRGGGLMAIAGDKDEQIKSVFSPIFNKAKKGEDPGFLDYFKAAANMAISLPAILRDQSADKDSIGAQGQRWLSDKGREIAAAAQEEINLNQAMPDNPVTQFAVDVARGTIDMGPMLAAGFLTRSPSAGAVSGTLSSPMATGIFAGQVAGDTYIDRLEKGVGQSEAMDAVKFNMLAEALPESITVAQTLLKRGSPFVKRFINSALGEGVQETATAILQDTYDNVTLENMSLKDALLSLDPKNVLYQGAVGMGVGGALSVPASAAEAVIREPVYDQQEGASFTPTHKVAGGIDAMPVTKNGQVVPDTYVDQAGKVHRDANAVAQPQVEPSAVAADPLDANAQAEAIKAEVMGAEAAPVALGVEITPDAQPELQVAKFEAEAREQGITEPAQINQYVQNAISGEQVELVEHGKKYALTTEQKIQKEIERIDVESEKPSDLQAAYAADVEREAQADPVTDSVIKPQKPSDYDRKALQGELNKLSKEGKEIEKARGGTVVESLASKGGLNIESMVSSGMDKADARDSAKKGVPFGKPLFRAKGGMTMDEAAEAMAEMGVPGVMTEQGPDLNVAFELIHDTIKSGEPLYLPGDEAVAAEQADRKRTNEALTGEYEAKLAEVDTYEEILAADGQKAADEWFYRQRAAEHYDVESDVLYEDKNITADSVLSERHEELSVLISKAIAINPDLVQSESERLIDASESEIAKVMYKIAGEKPKAGKEVVPEFEQPHELRMKEHEVAAEEEGLTPKQKERFAPKDTRDVVTGMYRAEDRHPTLDRAKEYIKSHKSEGAYADIDLRNLGGMNETFTHTEADVHFKAFADIVVKNLPKKNVVMTRHGGDEMSAIAPRMTKAELVAALDKAQAEIDQYVIDNNLDQIAHPKYEGKSKEIQELAKGTGIYFGVSKIDAELPNDDTIKAAEQITEGSKPKKLQGVKKDEAKTDGDRRKAEKTGLRQAETRRGADGTGEAQQADRGEGIEDVDAGQRDEGDIAPEPLEAAEQPVAPAEEINGAAHEAATSKENDLPEPSKAQKESGNYKKGHITVQGLDIAIENPSGSKRNPKWPVIKHHYGYIKGTVGADSEQGAAPHEVEQVDVFVNPDVDIAADTPIFIVDQFIDGKFDEHKVMIGFASEQEASDAYSSNYTKDWDGLKSISELTPDEFKIWLSEGDTTVSFVGGEKAIPVEEEAEVPLEESTKALEEKPATPEKITKKAESEASKILKDANVTGQERLSTLEKFRDGTYSLDDLREAYPAEEVVWPEAVPIEAIEEKPVEPEKKAPAEKITDVGEKIGGARKDVWSGFREKATAKVTDDEILRLPLSKIFPEPSYEKLAEQGADPMALALFKAMRDEVPAKGRSSYKKRQYLDKVNLVRETAAEILDNPDYAQKFIDGMRENRTLRPLAERVDLMLEMGFPASGVNLKGITLSKELFALYEGKKNVTKWIVDQTAKSRKSWGGMGGQIAATDTREEAVAALKKHLEREAAKPKGKKVTKFEVYKYRGRQGQLRGWIIGKKVGRNYIDLKQDFESSAKAREYVDLNYDELVDKLAKRKEIPAHRKPVNEARLGEDYRAGKDVNADEFMETFGFRGVEFGNWVEQGKRQEDINNAYDGLMDLAKLLDIPPKAISLNGELGMAFGARGRGSVGGGVVAAAHYERDKIVINLTKKQGAGSLAHEWFHSLDNYFSRMRGAKLSYVTDQPYELTDKGVRPEVLAALKGIVTAINDSGLPARAAELDGRKAKPYWATTIEMAARSFESYVISKLKEKGVSNDYLANIVSPEYWTAAEALGLEAENSYPYILGEELEAINDAYDNFFDVVETKETDQGVMLYSRVVQEPDSKYLLNNLPRDMREELFNEHAMNLNPEATELGFYAKRVPSGMMNIKDVQVDNIPESQLEYVMEADPADLPPIVISDGRLIDGQHRIQAARLKGVDQLRYIDVTGLIDTEAGGYISELPTEVSEEILRSQTAQPTSAESKADKKPAKSITAADLNRIVGRFQQEYKGAQPVKFNVRGMQDETFGEGSVEKDGRIKGGFYPGTNEAVLIAENIENKLDAIKVIRHEIVGHYGFRQLLNKNGEYDALLDRVHAAKDKELKDLYSFVKNTYPELIERGDTKTIADEMIARAAETKSKAGFIQRIFDEIIRLLNKFGIAKGLVSRAELNALIRLSEKNLQKPITDPVAGDGVDPLLAKDGAASIKLTEVEKDYFAMIFDSEADLVELREAAPSIVITENELTVDRGDLSSLTEYIDETVIRRETGQKIPPRFTTDRFMKLLEGAAAPQTDPSILFSRNERAGVANVGDSLGMPEETYTETAVRWFQNSFNRVKKLQEVIVERGGTVSDISDVYGVEERHSSKISYRLSRLDKGHMKPLLKQMDNDGITIEELDKYLIAKHAAERNAYIASINPDMQDGGSGLTNAEAAEIIDSFADKAATMEEAAKRVYAVNEQMLDDLVDGGHLELDTVNEWRERYDYYVPLKGKEGEEQRATLGKGYSVSGANIKAALGRGEGNLAESPTAHSFAQAESTIVRTEKTKIGQALINLIRENPDPAFWTISERTFAQFVDLYGEPFEGWENEPTGLVENTDYHRTTIMVDGQKQVVYRVDPRYKQRDDVFSVMVGGKELLVNIKDELVAEQLKKMNATQLNALVAGAGQVNRYLAMINTALNPEFVITNFERDFQTAMVNLSGEQSAAMAAKVAKGIPGAVRGIWQETFDTKGQSEWRETFKEMQEAGGTIGFFGLEDIDTKVKHIQNRLDRKRGMLGASKRGIMNVRDAVLDANLSVENAARLAAYKVAKEQWIANGMPEQEAINKAASLSKNLTVNFNRKGELAPVLNSAYLFYNASIQGSARIFTALKNPRVRKIVAGIAATSFALAMYNRAAGGDDEDGIPYWDKLGDHLKQTNLIIMHPDGSGEYSKIKLPYGYNVFFYAGTAMNDLMYDENKTVAGTAMNMLSATMNAFNPIQGADLADTITPTVLKPYFQSERNINFMDAQIKPDYPFDTYDRPESQKSFKSTNPQLKEMMALINEATGGDQTHAGLVDISPETVKHYVGWVTGGAGMFGTRALSTVTSLVTGEEIEQKNVPFWRSIGGKPGSRYDTQRFYDSVKEVAAVEAQLKLYKGTDQYSDYRAENLGIHKLAFHVRRYKNKIKRLRVKRDKAYAENDNDQAAEYREQIRSEMMEFSKMYEDAVASQ